MSSTCLSSATIVRCNALSRAETTGIFIPPALQFLMSIVLVASRWGSGKRKHLLLAGEGFVFFTLALLDLLAHQLDSPRNSINTFKIFDIVIGVLSFVPILLYTVFLYILTKTSFIPFIPRRFQRVATYTLLVFIPVLLATNEVGSFVGISYLMLQDILGNRVLAIGFRGSGDQAVWQFFNSITLAMLLTFQAVVFLLSLYHFLKPCITRKSNDDSEKNSKLDPYLLKGVGWVALGVKLASVETLLGFIDGHYNIIIARRVLRLLSRACMIVAILTGLDGFEDFRQTSTTVRKRPTLKKGDLQNMISNPRNSTFTRLSPHATTFYGLPRAADSDFNTARFVGGVSRADSSEEIRKARQQHRVTVRIDDGGKKAPTLDLRLSDLNIPSPEVLTATYNKRGTLVDNLGVGDEKDAMKRLQMRMRTDSETTNFTHSLATPDAVARRTFKYSAQSRAPVDLVRSKSSVSHASSKTSRSGLPSSVRRNNSDASLARPRIARHESGDTLDVVHQLAQQFPGIPPRVPRYPSGPGDGVVMIGDDYNGSIYRQNSDVNPFADPKKGTLSRQGSSGSAISAARTRVGGGELGKSTTSLVSHSSVKRKAPPPIDAELAKPSYVQVQVTGGSAGDSMYVQEYPRRASNASTRTSATTMTINRDPFGLETDDPDTPSTGLGTIAKRVAELERRRAAMKAQKEQPVVTDPFQDSQLGTGVNGAVMSRIKSIGRVSSRQTPTPSASEFVRQSVVIEQGQIGKNVPGPSRLYAGYLPGGVNGE